MQQDDLVHYTIYTVNQPGNRMCVETASSLRCSNVHRSNPETQYTLNYELAFYPDIYNE